METESPKEMKYTVGTIFRLFKSSTTNSPTIEFIIVDRERMINRRTNKHKDMYRIRYILTPYNTTDEWKTEKDLDSQENQWWFLEVYNG